MKQLCDDLRQFAIQVRQLGYSPDGSVVEWECLDLSERMLAAVKQAEARMAGAKSTPLVDTLPAGQTVSAPLERGSTVILCAVCIQAGRATEATHQTRDLLCGCDQHIQQLEQHGLAAARRRRIILAAQTDGADRRGGGPGDGLGEETAATRPIAGEGWAPTRATGIMPDQLPQRPAPTP